METKEYNNKIAHLETQIDYLESELSYLNTLLVNCGFPEGVVTLKKTVEEILGAPAPDAPNDDSELV